LITATKSGGFKAAVLGLRANLTEEKAMADGDANHAAVTVKFLIRQEAVRHQGSLRVPRKRQSLRLTGAGAKAALSRPFDVSFWHGWKQPNEEAGVDDLGAFCLE
jgi:glycerol-3-phosphate dehydrogenase